MYPVDSVTGLFYREDPKFHDIGTIRESLEMYGNEPVGPDDVVLDLGSHIGSSAKVFLEQNVKHVVCVEPNADNFKLLKRNIGRYKKRVTLFHAAAMPLGTKEAFLYLHTKEHSAMHRSQPVRGRDVERVPVAYLEDLLREFQPTVLKVDIEYAEYELPALTALPSQVRLIFAEWHGVMQIGHPHAIMPKNQRMLDMEQSILDQGFEALHRKEKKAWKWPYAICGTYARTIGG